MNNSQSWESVWSRQRSQGILHEVGVFLAELGDLQRIVFNSLKRTGKLSDKSAVLEVGCGTAPVMAMLEKYTDRRYGVDLSSSSALISGAKCISSMADGRFLPFSDESFDLVYSTGVMDLYDDRNANRFLREMQRVLKPDGRIVTVNAREGCVIHERIMKYLTERKRWIYGSKRSFSSLSGILPEGLRIAEEKGRGALFQLRFVSYLFHRKKVLRRIYHLVFLVLSVVAYPLNKLPGAVLVTELKKK